MPASGPLRLELDELLLHAPAACEAFFSCSQLLKALPFRSGAAPAVHLSQRLSQALSNADSELLQAPHMTPGLAAATIAALPAVDRAAPMRGLASMPAEGRSKLLRTAGMGEAEAHVCEAFFAHVFPRPLVTYKVAVKGEEDEGNGKGTRVYAGDMATVYATLTLAHRRKSSTARLAADTAMAALPPNVGAHAPNFPHARAEGWVMILTAPGGGQVLGLKPAPPWEQWSAAKAGGCSWTAELRTRAARAGQLKLEVHAVCSSYLGADVTADVVIRVEEDDDDDDDDDDGAAEDEEELNSSDFEFEGAGD